MAEKRLGGLALLRNRRLMQKAEVPRQTIADAIDAMRADRVLPYRFITAARYAPDFEPELESAMLLDSACSLGDPRPRGVRRGGDIHVQQ